MFKTVAKLGIVVAIAVFGVAYGYRRAVSDMTEGESEDVVEPVQVDAEMAEEDVEMAEEEMPSEETTDERTASEE